MSKMIEIDGSMGEGGGQILRTAIALSAVLGKPVRVYNIRVKRRNPGLRPQHLNAIRAIASLSNGRLIGDSVGSREVTFYPGRIHGRGLKIDIGTAGSISLILQALLPVMAYADSGVSVKIRGGTDVPMSPPIDYMREVLLRLLEDLGYSVSIKVLRRGHYPRGGGLVSVEVREPPRGFNSRSYIDRGVLRGVYLRSHAVRLPRHVAERQARSAASIIKSSIGVEPSVYLEWYEPDRDPHLGPGSGIVVWAIFDNTVMGGDSIGARGKRAEVVGREAASRLIEDVGSGACLDRHSSDMIPLYLALARGESVIYGSRLTLHALTVFKLLEIMVEGFSYEIIEGGIDRPFKALIKGAGVTG